MGLWKNQEEKDYYREHYYRRIKPIVYALLACAAIMYFANSDKTKRSKLRKQIDDTFPGETAAYPIIAATIPVFLAWQLPSPSKKTIFTFNSVARIRNSNKLI